MSVMMSVRKNAWFHACGMALLALIIVPLPPALGQGGPVALVELVPLQVAGASDTATSLPVALSQLNTGQSFVVEVWVRTSDAQGLSSVSTTILFDSVVAVVSGVIHTTLFSELPSGVVDNMLGSVVGLSGSHLSNCADQVGVAPTWARVAILNMMTVGSGSLLVQSGDTGMPALGTAICGVGDLLPAQVSYGSAPLTVISVSIPTVSQWGMVVFALIMLSVGTVTFRRRSRDY